ncbi:hypothetical protein HanRHA438_Chr16g0738111 [Helianthus annuus]|nr:hypothetical protein HanRHA438_Chr16g0738111 [Helianthus annuus]
MHSSPSFVKYDFDETKWVEDIRKSVDEQDDEEKKNIVCVFTVPKVLQATDPKCYIPQQVALGPFHHLLPDVHNMQRNKEAAARRTRKYMNDTFENIVKKMKEDHEAEIRACYHTFLSMYGDTLVWMMVVDTAYLLDFLQVYLDKKEGVNTKDVTKDLSHMAILRDVVKVENQIPLFLLRKMLAYIKTGELKNSDDVDNMLKTMLKELYRDLTAFVGEELRDHVPIEKCVHLLDFLYHMTVPEAEFYSNINPSTANYHEIDMPNDPTSDLLVQDEKEESLAKSPDVSKVWNVILQVIKKVGVIKKFKLGKPMAVCNKLPLVSLLKPIWESIFGRGQEKPKDENGEPKAPKIEEIKIPSVTDMAKAGIRFKPVEGGISNISFDVKTRTLYLPKVELDGNTKVYLRNLVAHEACVATGPLVMARYTKLMNGIIDTEQDAKYLSKRDIVFNYLKSDKEVADLWNGMSKSVKLTKVDYMDTVVANVNKMYDQTWRVKLSKLLKKYVFASWKILTLLAALLMLFLTTVQAFCSVYSCVRVFHQLPEIPAQGVE